LPVRQETNCHTLNRLVLACKRLTGTGRKKIINICLTTYSDLITYRQKDLILRIREKFVCIIE